VAETAAAAGVDGGAARLLAVDCLERMVFSGERDIAPGRVFGHVVVRWVGAVSSTGAVTAAAVSWLLRGLGVSMPPGVEAGSAARPVEVVLAAPRLSTVTPAATCGVDDVDPVGVVEVPTVVDAPVSEVVPVLLVVSPGVEGEPAGVAEAIPGEVASITPIPRAAASVPTRPM
jgi:hypothetical protein